MGSVKLPPRPKSKVYKENGSNSGVRGSIYVSRCFQ